MPSLWLFSTKKGSRSTACVHTTYMYIDWSYSIPMPHAVACPGRDNSRRRQNLWLARLEPWLARLEPMWLGSEAWARLRGMGSAQRHGLGIASEPE
ncbi:hypothetical protein HYQ46_010200 [Verticillium longisporum]|nr:hypothetical protein HYQ46_010200 [Verticillium longisporum]